MAKSREHRADYSLEEMLQLTGMDRKKFVDALNRVCEMYGLPDPKAAFKTDETKQKSGYLFPMEIGELLALLIRNQGQHPLGRRNADPSKLSATSIAEYNRAMVEDIDNLSPYFKDIVYSLDAHLVAQQISDWAVPLVHEFTHFLYNLATIRSENVGAALKMFTKELNKMNYNLYRGNYIMNFVIEQNRKMVKNQYGTQEEELLGSAKVLGQQNVSIDRLIAEAIKSEMVIAYGLRTEDLLSAEELLEQKLELMKMCGEGVYINDNEECLRASDVKNLSDEDLRQIYCGIMLKDTINQSRLAVNQQAIEVIRNAPKWKSIEEKIQEGIFMDPAEVPPPNRSVNQKAQLDNDMDESDPDTDELAKKLFGGLKAGYVEHTQKVDQETGTLKEIVDQFIGRALNEFLSRSWEREKK